MTRLLDTAIADAIGLAKKERRAAPVIHYLCALAPELARRLAPEERDALDALPVVGGRAADDELNERYLDAWDRYDELRKTMKRQVAMARLVLEFSDLDAEKLWEMTAGRIRHLIRTHRFDKMSRTDIAARIIEYLENSDTRARDILERSMRNALASMDRKKSAPADRESFLSQWERIIKGTEL